MAYEVQTALIAGVAGLIAGGASSVVAPWVNWRLSEKKAQREAKTKIIGDARALVAALGQQHGATRLRLPREPAYLAVRPHLRPDDVTRVEKGAAGDAGPVTNLRQAIDDLEKTWRLP